MDDRLQIDHTADVELISVTKRYGSFTAVDNFSLSVPRGSFTTLLGPSGCGKTTLLRLIAGFFPCDEGEIRILGQNQRGIPPEARSCGIVFQDYALFPHLTVFENLAYGLKIRKLDRNDIAEKVSFQAAALGLERLLGRYPHELSGGQQQRLALGRVLVLRPRVLLMDEPLSNLDAKLRVKVRAELKAIQQKLGITTIYVTHDQEEALSLSDQLAVMDRGRLIQQGTPPELYNEPASAFAADVTGPANFITIDGKRCLVRPEWVSVSTQLDDPPALGTPVFEASVVTSEFLGRVVRLHCSIGTNQTTAHNGVVIHADNPIAADVDSANLAGSDYTADWTDTFAAPGTFGLRPGQTVRVTLRKWRELT